MAYKMKYGGDTVCMEDEEIDADGVTCKKKEEKKEDAVEGGRHRRHSRRHHHRRKTMRVSKGTHVKAKTLRRLLKSKGLKVSGKKATLRARARKAHLIRGGGGVTSVPSSTGASV